MATADVYATVNTHYSSLARSTGSDISQHSQKVALSFGYDADELAAIPEGANLGVSCGNPLAVAGLRPGETVVDLGSGAGFDVFLAARKVGDEGKAIGVDMSKDMLARARLNAAKANITNVLFVESPITSINLPSSSIDCVISNCVINLVPAEDKHLVFEEVFRMLKPGGRVAVSDILARKEFPRDLQRDMALYVGCISGASLVEEYEKWLKDAGFQDIMIIDKHNDLNIYKEDTRKVEKDKKASNSSCCSLDGTKDEPVKATQSACCGSIKQPEEAVKPKAAIGSCCGTSNPTMKEGSKNIIDIDFNEWVGSFSVYAVKP